MSAPLANYLSVWALSLSAVAWLAAAIASPIIRHSYWDGLPKKLIRQQKIAALANTIAAVLAAAGTALQAYASAH